MQESSECFVCSFTLVAVEAPAASSDELLFVKLPSYVSTLHHGMCRKSGPRKSGAGIRSKSWYLFLFHFMFISMSCPAALLLVVFSAGEVKTMFIVLVPSRSSAVRSSNTLNAGCQSSNGKHSPLFDRGFHLLY